MHIHRFEKFWIVLALALIVFFVGTGVYTFSVMDLRTIGDEGEKFDPAQIDETPFGDPGTRRVAEGEYEVYIVSRQFLFEPGTGDPVRVPQDAEVTFYVTSSDVIHGLQVIGTNLNVMAVPGQTSKFTTSFPEVRTYGMVCHEFCGGAHHEMEGLLEVVPEDEFSDDYLVN